MVYRDAETTGLFNPEQRQMLPSGALARCGEARFSHGGWPPLQARFLTEDLVASLGSKGELYLFSARTGYCFQKIALPTRAHRDFLGERQIKPTMLALSSDRKTLFVAGAEVSVFDVESFSLLRSISLGSKRQATALSLSGCGRWGLLHTRTDALKDGRLELWDAALSQKIAETSWNIFIEAAAFTSDGEYILIAEHDSPYLSLLEVPSLKKKHRLHTKGPNLSSMASLPDGRVLLGAGKGRLFTARVDARWHFWRKLSLEALVAMWVESDCDAIVCSPDGASVAASVKNQVYRVSLSDKTPPDLLAQGKIQDWYGASLLSNDSGLRVHVLGSPRSLGSPGGALSTITFTDDSTRLLAASYDQPTLWSAHSGELLAVGTRSNDTTSWKALSGEELSLAERALYNKSDITRYVLAKVSAIRKRLPGNRRSPPKKDSPVNATALSGDGKRCAILFDDGKLCIFDRDGSLLGTGEHPMNYFLYNEKRHACLAFNNDGSLLFLVTDKLKVFNERCNEQELSRTSTFSQPMKVYYDDERQLLWVQDGGETLRALRYPSGEVVRQVHTKMTREASKGYEQDQAPRVFAVSPDGKFVAHGSDGGFVVLCDLQTGEAKELITDWDWVWSLAFSPDGSKLAAGGSDGTALIWELSAVVAQNL